MGRRMNYWKQVLNLELGTWCFSVGQSCPTLCDPVDCNLLGFSVHGILQARILEWVPAPGDLPNPGIEPRFPAMQAGMLSFNL